MKDIAPYLLRALYNFVECFAATCVLALVFSPESMGLFGNGMAAVGGVLLLRHWWVRRPVGLKLQNGEAPYSARPLHRLQQSSLVRSGGHTTRITKTAKVVDTEIN